MSFQGRHHKPETIKKLKKWRPNEEQLKKMTHRREKHGKWRGDDIITKCPICGKGLISRPGKEKKYCSYACLGKSKAKEKNRCVDCGKIVSRLETKRCNKCNGLIFTGKNNPTWKGEKVGYFALHVWIRKNLGRPVKCEKCGIEGKNNGRAWSIQWANTDHKYRRNLADWIALCDKCHKQYDINKKMK